MNDLVWRKSSRGTDQGICVEVADLDDGARAVRDSKDPTGLALMFTATEWAAFTAGCVPASSTDDRRPRW